MSKNKFSLITACTVLVTLSLFTTGCSKSNSGAGPGGTGGSGASKLMQPVSVSFYEGNNSAYPTKWTYTYDQNNLLLKYGLENSWIKEVNEHGSTLTTFSSTDVFSTLYNYQLTGELSNPSSIYSGIVPNQIRHATKVTDRTTNVTRFLPEELYSLGVNASRQIEAIVPPTNNAAGQYNFYDKDNLSAIEYRRGNTLVSRLTVDALDDKPSPFSAVKGYNFIAWPVGYAWDFALAYCKNNPLSITVKDGAVISERSTFTYEYNEQGYPTKVFVSTTYNPNGNPSTFTRTYNYTYRSL